MEKAGRVRQLYGYTVCLIAVVTGLISVAGLLNNAFDLSNPLAAERGYDVALTSFESYKATRDRRGSPSDQRQTSDTTSEAALRARYEALRADRITHRRFEAWKGLVTDVILLGVALALFVTHWRWLQRLPDVEPAGRAA